METIKKSKRIKWLDFAKGITIFFVVLGHAIGYANSSHNIIFTALSYIIAAFIMPIFFAVSGFLYKPTNTLRKYLILLYKKIGSFVIPYFVFTFIILFLQNMHNFLHIISNNWLRIIILPSGYMWFLYSLFFIFIIVGLFDLLHISLYVQTLIYIIFTFLSMHFVFQESFTHQIVKINRVQGAVNPISGTLGYFLCFYLGYCIRKYHLYKYLKNQLLTLVMAISWIVLILIQFYYDKSIDTDAFNYIDMVAKLLSIPVFFSIFVSFNQKNRLFSYFDKYGKFTLIIYLVHIPVILVIKGFLLIFNLKGIFNLMPFVYFLVLFIPAWFIPIIICYLVKHNKVLTFIFYPRKYLDSLLNKYRN